MSLDASRCPICGTQFDAKAKASGQPRAVQGTRIPEITISLPVVILLFAVFLLSGAGLTYLGLSAANRVAEPSAIPSETVTPTPSLTPTPETPTPTFTPQPTGTPLSYVVKANDTCGSIAFAFSVSVQSIILQNSLSADCALFINQELKIPQPTATPSPMASATLSDPEATIAACETTLHVVQEGETLSQIAVSYGFEGVDAIMEWNGKTVDTAFLGERLVIPLCQRQFVLGIGTVTPSPAPPYPAPELLLPRNGEAFAIQQDAISLQWSSVGELRTNEFYQVTVTDITSGGNISLTVEVKDTRFNLPLSLRPSESRPHIFEWQVVVVAQIGVKEDGSPIFVSGGSASEKKVFSWSGGTGTPSPA